MQKKNILKNKLGLYHMNVIVYLIHKDKEQSKKPLKVKANSKYLQAFMNDPSRQARNNPHANRPTQRTHEMLGNNRIHSFQLFDRVNFCKF